VSSLSYTTARFLPPFGEGIDKAEIVKDLLKGEKTLGQVASETGIHPTQLKEWKRIALTRLPELFSRNDQASEDARLHEQRVNELYAEIGRLTTQVNWLKKKSGLQPE
jgi:transposase-like protein